MKTIRLAIAICLMITASACSSSNNDGQSKPAGSSAAPSTQPAGGNSTSAKQASITKEQYDKIDNGMTYQEVVDIIGGEGEIVTETGKKGSDMYGMGVMYKGKDGANATFIFLGNKLESKSQYELK